MLTAWTCERVVMQAATSLLHKEAMNKLFNAIFCFKTLTINNKNHSKRNYIYPHILLYLTRKRLKTLRKNNRFHI